MTEVEHLPKQSRKARANATPRNYGESSNDTDMTQVKRVLIEPFRGASERRKIDAGVNDQRLKVDRFNLRCSILDPTFSPSLVFDYWALVERFVADPARVFCVSYDACYAHYG